jgi:CheY-like chemotaxis protein
MRYRIALCGFSEFEHRALDFSFRHPAEDGVDYDVVDDMDDADYVVVDADSNPTVRSVVVSSRVAHSVFVGSEAPAGAGALVPRPIDPPRILRALTDLTLHLAPTQRDMLLPLDADDRDDFIVSEPPMLMDAVEFPSAGHAAAPAPDVADPVESESPAAVARHARKAAARAAARRARLSHTHTDPGQLEQLRDVLVLDADDDAGAHLTELLRLFGFRVHTARNLAEAADILSRYPLVAAFLDISLNGPNQGDGLTLIQTINDLPRLLGHPAPPVLLVTARLRPADRVRAALAGVAAPLIKPVTRGDVARALESCDVLLPADARRL